MSSLLDPSNQEKAKLEQASPLTKVSSFASPRHYSFAISPERTQGVAGTLIECVLRASYDARKRAPCGLHVSYRASLRKHVCKDGALQSSPQTWCFVYPSLKGWHHSLFSTESLTKDGHHLLYCVKLSLCDNRCFQQLLYFLSCSSSLSSSLKVGKPSVKEASR